MDDSSEVTPASRRSSHLSNISQGSRLLCRNDKVSPTPSQLLLPEYPQLSVLSQLSRPLSYRKIKSEGEEQQPKTPEIKEEDLETVLDTKEVPLYDDTGKRTYEKACEKLGVIPASNCLRSLTNSESLDIQHYGLGPRGAMAVAMAFVINQQVTTVNIAENGLGPRGMLYLQRMMEENTTITDLNVSDNQLGTEGAKSIGDLLRVNKVIRHLDVSGNDFTDTDAIHITKAVEEHTNLSSLRLSHNNFGDLSAEVFERMIVENGSLQELDLSWNHFRGGGARRLAQGVTENISVKTFDVSWNGFDDEGAIAMASALEHNAVLLTLDVSCNRIGPEGFMELLSALKLNDTLEVLKVGKNNITEDGAHAGIEVLRRADSVKLKILDMSDVILSPRFTRKLSDLYDLHPHLEVIYGYTDSYGKRKLKMYDVFEEGMNKIYAYLTEKNMTMVELFTRFDADGSMSITHDEFKEGLRDACIPLTSDQVNSLIVGLDSDGDGEIDFSEIIITTQKSLRPKEKKTSDD